MSPDPNDREKAYHADVNAAVELSNAAHQGAQEADKLGNGQDRKIVVKKATIRGRRYDMEVQAAINSDTRHGRR